MTTKNLTKKLIDSTFNRTDNPYKIGHCWHCGKKLILKIEEIQKKEEFGK